MDIRPRVKVAGRPRSLRARRVANRWCNLPGEAEHQGSTRGLWQAVNEGGARARCEGNGRNVARADPTRMAGTLAADFVFARSSSNKLDHRNMLFVIYLLYLCTTFEDNFAEPDQINRNSFFTHFLAVSWVAFCLFPPKRFLPSLVADH